MQTNPNGIERRRFHRIVHDSPAMLFYNEKTSSVHLIDLSLKGCLLSLPSDWQAQTGTSYKLSIQLSDSVEIRMDLALVRNTAEHAGFQFTHIDLDSICQLKRLVELNLGDSSLLERDLNALTAA